MVRIKKRRTKNAKRINCLGKRKLEGDALKWLKN